MGGAIPLQQPAAPAGTGDFPYPAGTNCRYVNCGRAALRLLLQHLPTAPARVWIPRFVCDTVAEAPASRGLPVLRYSILAVEKLDRLAREHLSLKKWFHRQK